MLQDYFYRSVTIATYTGSDIHKCSLDISLVATQATFFSLRDQPDDTMLPRQMHSIESTCLDRTITDI